MTPLPRAVVLDGYALNPGDLDWRPLREITTLTVHDRTAVADILPHAADAPILLSNKTPLDAAALAQLPALRYVGVLATGYNVIDVAAARSRGIVVTNVPEYGTAAVAQHTIALLLELTSRVGLHAESVRLGEWARSADWCYWHGELLELAGRTLGLVGVGRIGGRVAEIARALGMTVLTFTSRSAPEELDALLAAADVVSLHCPLTERTRAIIDENALRRMKPTAFLLNTARGPLVDELALDRALREGWIAGAALDVLGTEPPAADHPLVGNPRCLITPHCAWAAHAARARLLRTAVENVRAFLAGAPVNAV